MFATIKADISRYARIRPSSVWLTAAWWIIREPGLFAVVVYRYGFWINKRYGSYGQRFVRYFFRIFYLFGHRLSIYRCKIDILEATDIGPGLRLDNQGGIILGARSIGKNCTIGPRVTVGMDAKKQIPVIGDNVIVGSDVVMYGAITVGNDVVIESGTVLSKSIPAKAVVSGNPGRIVQRDTNMQRP